MMSMRLYAIAIDEADVLFHAPPDTAVALRAIARDLFGPTGGGARGGRPSWFGRPASRPLPPDHPTDDDIDTLLNGRFVRPDRLIPSWRLIETWIAAMSWGQRHDPLDVAQLDAIDFDLAKAGVAPSLGLRALVSRGWNAPIGFVPGLVAGAVTGEHVDAMLAAWTPVIDELDGAHAGLVRERCEWFAQFARWREAAGAQHRPSPDLVTIFGG